MLYPMNPKSEVPMTAAKIKNATTATPMMSLVFCDSDDQLDFIEETKGPNGDDDGSAAGDGGGGGTAYVSVGSTDMSPSSCLEWLARFGVV
jgi:hypothetical protein